jgi:hypothetical protein
VVVPCFNVVETTTEQLESVLEQPHVGQVVVVHDGSLVVREQESRLRDLNPGPTHYECVALPLS